MEVLLNGPLGANVSAIMRYVKGGGIDIAVIQHQLGEDAFVRGNTSNKGHVKGKYVKVFKA